MARIPFDIETIPSQDPNILIELTERAQPPGNIKKAESIAAWLNGTKPYEGDRAAKVSELQNKTGLNGRLGHICNMAFGHYETDEIYSFSLGSDASPENETRLICEFLLCLKEVLNGRSPHFVGYNLKGFDLRFLYHRCAVLSIRPTFSLGRFVNGRHGHEFTDLMLEFCGYQKNDFVGQDKVCRSLGFPGKAGMDGSKVYGAWLAGEHKKISEYNVDDIIAVRNIDRRLLTAGGYKHD